MTTIEELNARRLALLARKYRATGSELSSAEEKILGELQAIIATEMPRVTCADWWALAEARIAALERRISYLEQKASVMR